MSETKTKTKTGIKTTEKTTISKIKNIESVGVEIESCANNNVLWKPIIESMDGIEYLHAVEWHGDGSINCSNERRRYPDKDMTDSEFTTWTTPKYVNYIFKLYETLYHKITLRQNDSTGNHIHLRFKDPISYYIVTSPAFIFQFQQLYARKYELDSKYVNRLDNRYSTKYRDINDILDNQLSGSRYRTINALSLLKHRSWTIEFRILPWAENPREYREMVMWLLTTVDQLITDHKQRIKGLKIKMDYDKEGVRVGNTILGNDFVKLNHDINEGVPALSWLHIQSSIITNLLNRRYGLNLSYVTYSNNMSPISINYIYYHDLSILRRKAIMLNSYNAYVEDRRVLIPNSKIDYYNREIGERINAINDRIRQYFTVNTLTGINVNSPEYSDNVFNPLNSIIIKYDWNTRQIRLIINTGYIRGGGYLAISVDAMAKRYVKNMVGLIKFLKENILEFRIMAQERQVIA